MTADTSDAPLHSDSTVSPDNSSIAAPSEPTPTIAPSSPSASPPRSPSEPVIPEESQSAQEPTEEPPVASAIEVKQDTNPSAQTPAPQQQTPAAQNRIQSHQWSAAHRARATAKHARNKQERLDKIIAYARTKPHITNDEIEKLLHVSDATASRYTKALVSQGLLRAEGKGRGAKYVLSHVSLPNRGVKQL